MKRIVSIILCVLLASAVCSFAAAEGEPVKVTMMTFADQITSIEGIPVFDELQKRLGIELEMQMVTKDDYSAKQTLALSSGDMPDIMLIDDTANLSKYGDEGAFINLFDYRDQLPNFFAKYDENEQEFNAYLSPNGALYGFYRIYQFKFAGEGVLIRDDVVTELGYDRMSIRTIEDLTEVLYAMKAAYPDSTPLIGRWGLDYCTYLGNMSASTGLNMIYNRATGEFEYGATTEAYREVAQWYATLAKDGIFNLDFGISNDDWKQAYYTSKAFCGYDYISQMDTLSKLGVAEDPDFALKGIPLPKWGDYMTGGASAYQVFATRMMAISASTRNLDACLRFMDYLYSDEGITLTNWGIEGLSYTQDEQGVKHFVDNMVSAANPDGELHYAKDIGIALYHELTRYVLTDTYNALFRGIYASEASAYVQSTAYISYEVPSVTFTDEEKELRANVLNPINTYTNENIALFITGARPFEEWDSFVDTLYEMGVQDMVDLYNSKLQ